MADPGKVNIVLVPALLGLVGFFIYYKKNNKQAGAGKSAKPGKTKPGKTKPAKAEKTKPAKAEKTKPAKAEKAKRSKKADSASPEPVSPKPQRQMSKAGGRMGSVL